MPLEVRQLTDDDMPAAFRVFTTALQVAMPSEEDLEKRRPGWYAERAVGAFDGGRLVAHVGSWPFDTTVPGGARVATAGLSRVGVLPTHRRRGVLTALMRRHLDGCAERGEALGSLRASEAGIYGRFGYGLAGLAADVRLDRRRAVFAREVPDEGRMRILPGSEVLDVLPVAYERCRWRVGSVSRPAPMWAMRYRELAGSWPSSAEWVAVHEDRRGRPDGFVHWKHEESPDFWGKGTRVAVVDLFGGEPLVEAALWRFVLDLDLASTVESERRPLDDPLRWWLADARVLGTTAVWDEQWVRLVDVAAALGARTYGTDESVVIEVTEDRLLPANVGRYQVGDGGCRRVRPGPDLRMDVTTLGAVSLGGTTFTELALAGRVEEVRRGALRRAERLFATRPLPWCGTFF